MTADPLAAELARTRAELRRAEDEIRDLRAERVILRAQLRDRGYVDLELPEQRSEEPQVGQLPGAGKWDETVAVPRRILGKLIRVASHVSVGKSFAFVRPYPDALARVALGALHDAGLLPPDLCPECGEDYRSWPDPDDAEGVQGWNGLTYCSMECVVRAFRGAPKEEQEAWQAGVLARHAETPVMIPEQQARFDADHADGPTPGCDCGHNGMGRAWHARDCEWRAGLRDAANPS